VYLPTPSDWLSERAKDYWTEIGSVLLNVKFSTAADGPALQLLTEALSEWSEAWQYMLLNGLNYETYTERGNTMHRPYPKVAIVADAWRRSLRMLTEFGLTPASRNKVSTIGGDSGKDPFEEMMTDMKA
jgi:P27 family predicted phage terminase small subunit